MGKQGPQCKIGNRETNALAKALESKYPVNKHTILSKIESYQTIYDKDPMYVPSVAEMEAFLDLQAAQGDLVVPASQVTVLRKQVDDGTATMIMFGDDIYIGTKSGMIVKELPNHTLAVINLSEDNDDNIAIINAFEAFFCSDDDSLQDDQDIPGVELIEDSEKSYLSRTRKNAEWSDITLALGEDLTTAGELQTAKFAGAEVEEEERTNSKGESYTKVLKVKDPKKGKYIGITLDKTPSAAKIAEDIYKQIKERNLPTEDLKLNIAGNGIYTLESKQEVYDNLLTEVIKELQDRGITIAEIRSGGQTGIDEAGTKAAMALGINASIVAPKGFKFRNKEGKDLSDRNSFIQRFNPQYKDAPTVVPASKKIFWKRVDVEADVETLYIFSDNTDRDSGKDLIDPNSDYTKKYGKGKHYPSMTSAAIRGLNNAMPISTQHWYHEGAKGKSGQWVDTDAEEFEKTIKEEVDAIIEKWNLGKYKRVIVPSGDGFFNSSISEITKERVPSLYKILTDQITRLEEAIGKDNIKTFSAPESSKSKNKRKKSVVIYEDEDVLEAMKKAKEYTIISNKQLGANSAWRIAAENYGIETINMSNAETYDDLDVEEKAELELPYHKAAVALKINEIKLSNAAANKSTLKAGKLGRMMYNQIKSSNGVFLITELVAPGAETEYSRTHNRGLINKASFTVAGDHLNSIAIYHAMQMEKPLHVYDEHKDSWMTYNYNTKEWEKEDTPALTERAFTHGRNGSREGRGFEETIGEKNWQAIRDVMVKTFGWVALAYVDKHSKGLSEADMNAVWQDTKKQAEKYSLDQTGIKIDKTNEMAKLTQAMSSNERHHRTQYLAREFSAVIDDLIEKDKQDIKDRVLAARVKVDGGTLEGEELKTWKKILEREEKYKKVLEGPDEAAARRTVIKRHGLTGNDPITGQSFGILDTIKDRIKECIFDAEDSHKKAKWEAVLDNFNPLMNDAFDIIQYIENFRLVPYSQKGSKNISVEVSTDPNITQADEDNLVDDEGNNMEGNSGWAFKVRFVDPRQSLSQITKKALNTIQMRDENGKPAYDDLGMPSYVNGDYAHAVLINELSELIDADDFCRQVENRNGVIKFEFPALEKLAVKYPWVTGLINKLRRNNQLAGAFFHDFNKAFIKYYSCDYSGKPLPLNSAIAEDAAYNNLKNNYENSIALTSSSIYNEGGLEKENAASLLEKLNAVNKQINGFLEDRDYIEKMESKGKGKQVKEEKTALLSDLGTVAKDLTFILKSMGFNTDELYLRNNLYLLLAKNNKGKIPYSKLSDNLISVLTAISRGEDARSKKKVKEDSNYLIDFQGQIKNICKLVGQVSEADNVQSFRDGNKTRYSYSAVNYAINMVKQLKSDTRRAKYLEEEFKYDDWFYHNGEWQNYWLEVFSKDDSDSQYLRENLELCEVISMQQPERKGDPIKYGDWDEYQTYRVMLGQFFSKASGEEGLQLANYNFPIFSDSPTSMYITMRRFIDTAKEGTFKDQMIPLFTKLVKQEMRRIKLVQDRKKVIGDAERIKCFDTFGDKFQFFPELNTIIDSETGLSFKKAAIQYLEECNIDALDELIARTLAGTVNASTGQREGGLMDNLFMEFLSEIPATGEHLADMIDELGGIKKITNVKQYAKDNNISLEEAEKTVERINEQSAIDALENYFWNSVFATSQIIELTTTDIAYYESATDFFKRFKEVYAAGNRLNTNTRYGRKVENTIYISDHFVTASKYTLIKKSLDNAVESERMSEEERDTILEKMKNIKATDAQAFRNPFAFRAVLDMMGAWSDEMDESFNRILNNEYDAGDFAVVWQTIKPFLFANVPTDNGLGGRMRTPHQHKNSEYLSLAFYDLIALSNTNNRTLKDSEWLTGLGKFFNEHKEIDVVQFESAVKAGGQGIVNLSYNRDTVEDFLFDTEEKDGIEVKIPTKYYHRAKEVMTEKNFKKSDNMEKLKAALDSMLEHGEISQEEYNQRIEETEPTSDELYELLNKQIADPETGEFKISSDRTGGTFNHSVVHQLMYADYMIAQPTPPHFMDQDEATSGSQFRNLILANLSPDFKCTVTIKRDGVETTVTLNRTQIRNLYRGAIVNNLLDSFEQLRDGTFSDIHTLQKKLLSAVQNNPKYGTDIVDALQIITIEDPLNPGKTIETFNMPLDLPTISNQIQELLLSTFKNHITKQTINGGSFIQVSNTGLTKKLHVERNEDGTIKYAECMLPAWSEKFFKYYMSEDSKGRKFLDIDKMPEDLRRMVGYRIPTENKYSMLPLRVVGFLPAEQGGSIMLPADITSIAGSDFDVDKMFLRIPAFEEVRDTDKTRHLQKVTYNIENLSEGEEWRATSQGSMTKLQRDNMMIDIEYAVLTSQEGSEQVYKPGNFDTVKKWGKVSRIINDSNLRRQFVTQYGHLIGINTEDAVTLEERDNADTILQILHHKSPNSNGTEVDTLSLDDIEDFLDRGQQMNALLPQTYNYMHTQNMVGASLVGVYANGASLHTKMQETYLEIDKEHTFSIAGADGEYRVIQSLHDQTTKIGENTVYIQELIAQLQAASVDNAKDPTLADLYQSMFTSGVALMMCRAGIDLEELSYFFGVEKATNKAGLEVKNRQVRNLFSHVLSKFGAGVITEGRKVSVEEIINTNLYIQKYPDLIKQFLNTKSSSKEQGKGSYEEELEAYLQDYCKEHDLTMEEIDNILVSIYHTYDVLTNIKTLKTKLKPANDIMQCDSTNHALAVSIPESVLQRFEVDRVNAIMGSRDFPFEARPDEPVNDEFIMNKIITGSLPRAEMEERLMSRRLPHIQAFYSLGIELPLGMMRNFLIQGNSELQENLISILKDASDDFFGRTSDGGFKGTRLVNAYFREYMQYILSMTDEFGDSDSSSYDVKRLYYLEKFAHDFMKLKKKKHPAIMHNSTLSRMTITRPSGEDANKVPQLILPKSGKLTPLMKASIRRDLDMLLYSEDPEVVELGVNLFKYSFYNNGFNYGPNAFGSYFDSAYWNAMPRVMELLRTFKHNNTEVRKSLQNFTEMFIANHSDDPTDTLIMIYKVDWELTKNSDNTITVDRTKVYSRMSGGVRKYIRVLDSTKTGFTPYILVKDNGYDQKTVVYKPAPVFDEPHSVYNANSNAEDMMDMYFNDRKKKTAEKLAAQKEEGKAKKSTKGSTLSATDTGNTEKVDNALSQVDAAERQGTGNIDNALSQSTVSPQEEAQGKSVEAVLLKINNEDDIPQDTMNSIEERLREVKYFMEITEKNNNQIESLIRLRNSLSKEETTMIDKITHEAKEKYDEINKCNIK